MSQNLIEKQDDISSIGHLVMAFQYMESEVLRIVVAMCMPGKERAITTLASQLSFSKLVHCFSSLIASLCADTTVHLQARTLAGTLCGIEAERNRYVHSHYDLISWSHHGREILRRKRKVDLKHGYREEESWFNPAEVDKVIDALSLAFGELQSIESSLLQSGTIPSFDEE